MPGLTGSHELLATALTVADIPQAQMADSATGAATVLVPAEVVRGLYSPDLAQHVQRQFPWTAEEYH